jgi:hypothetical protein
MAHLIQVILDTLRNHRTFELTAIPILFVLIGGTIAAVFQLWSQARANKASVLMTMDQQSKDEGIKNARAIMRKIQREISRCRREIWEPGHMPPSKIDRETDMLARAIVNQLYENYGDLYMRIVDALGYFETIGYTVRRGYLGFKDAYNLWGGIILGAGTILEGHIESLQTANDDKKIYEHFLWILRKCRHFDGHPGFGEPVRQISVEDGLALSTFQRLVPGSLLFHESPQPTLRVQCCPCQMSSVVYIAELVDTP